MLRTKGLHTIGNTSWKQLRDNAECSNNDIVTLIFIALDELSQVSAGNITQETPA